MNANRNQWCLTERIDPIFIPEESQQLIIEFGFENGNFNRIVSVGVYTKIFNLLQWDRLVVRCGVCRFIALKIFGEHIVSECK